MARRIVKNDYTPPSKEEIEKENEKKLEEMYVNSDHPNTIENGTATFWYIVIMIVGTFFNDRLLIYVVTSIIYFNFINRKKIRKKKWDKIQEEKKNGGNK